MEQNNNKNNNNNNIRWFKKRNSFSTYFNWSVGKSIIMIELGLYVLSMKCILIDVIPNRLQEYSYLDIPLTCFILLGYLLTFRSLFLACFTDSATIITNKNYLSQEQHQQEQMLREQEQQEIKLKKEQDDLKIKLEKEQAKKLKQSQKQKCCAKRKSQNDSNKKNDDINSQGDNQNNDIINKENENKSKNNDNKQKNDKIKKSKDETNNNSNNSKSHECKDNHCKENHQNSNKQNNKPQRPRLCLKCNIAKDRQDHHCSMCNKCVYRLDHHCFFIGQCVGDYNYLYFLSYVFLSYLMTLLTLISIIPDVADFISLDWDKLSCSFIEIFILILGGLLFHFFTMTLLISHLYYISNETTFLENKHSIKKQEYSPLEWVCIVIKCQSRQKLYHSFTARWYQIFGNNEFISIVFPDKPKIKID